jgi:hypothetical protein
MKIHWQTASWFLGTLFVLWFFCSLILILKSGSGYKGLLLLPAAVASSAFIGPFAGLHDFGILWCLVDLATIIPIAVGALLIGNRALRRTLWIAAAFMWFFFAFYAASMGV